MGKETKQKKQPSERQQKRAQRPRPEEVVSRDGVYTTHIRNRGERFADASREAIAVARRTAPPAVYDVVLKPIRAGSFLLSSIVSST